MGRWRVARGRSEEADKIAQAGREWEEERETKWGEGEGCVEPSLCGCCTEVRCVCVFCVVLCYISVIFLAVFVSAAQQDTCSTHNNTQAEPLPWPSFARSPTRHTAPPFIPHRAVCIYLSDTASFGASCQPARCSQCAA